MGRSRITQVETQSALGRMTVMMMMTVMQIHVMNNVGSTGLLACVGFNQLRKSWVHKM